MKPLMSRLEYQQLELICPPNSKHHFRLTLQAKLNTLLQMWQTFVYQLIEPQNLHLWCTRDRQGKMQWNAYDPTTKRSIYNVSEEQMRVWIEQRHRSY